MRRFCMTVLSVNCPRYLAVCTNKMIPVVQELPPSTQATQNYITLSSFSPDWTTLVFVSTTLQRSDLWTFHGSTTQMDSQWCHLQVLGWQPWSHWTRSRRYTFKSPWNNSRHVQLACKVQPHPCYWAASIWSSYSFDVHSKWFYSAHGIWCSVCMSSLSSDMLHPWSISTVQIYLKEYLKVNVTQLWGLECADEEWR